MNRQLKDLWVVANSVIAVIRQYRWAAFIRSYLIQKRENSNELGLARVETRNRIFSPGIAYSPDLPDPFSY